MSAGLARSGTGPAGGKGLTETAPILTFNPPGRARLDSAGLPVAGVELRIEPPMRADGEPPDSAPRASAATPEHGEIQARLEDTEGRVSTATDTML